MPIDPTDGRRYVEILGLRVYVGTDAECEQAAIVVCGNVSMFPDDVHGFCSRCGTPIVFRPYVPTRPPKVCSDCALASMRVHHEES